MPTPRSESLPLTPTELFQRWQQAQEVARTKDHTSESSGGRTVQIEDNHMLHRHKISAHEVFERLPINDAQVRGNGKAPALRWLKTMKMKKRDVANWFAVHRKGHKDRAVIREGKTCRHHLSEEAIRSC